MTVINTLAYIFSGAYFGTVIGDYVFKKDGKVRILFSIVIFLISVTNPNRQGAFARAEQGSGKSGHSSPEARPQLPPFPPLATPHFQIIS